LADQSSLVAGYTFLSDGWCSLIRPSSSDLTTASSSLACSTVPNSPVGFPKLRKPSTRSPEFSSWSVAEGSASGGFLARSESGVAPGYGRGGWGSFVQFGYPGQRARVVRELCPDAAGQTAAAGKRRRSIAGKTAGSCPLPRRLRRLSQMPSGISTRPRTKMAGRMRKTRMPM
jgi:hypothetical protein